ncbi:RICIN domain-containing protein [Streptomyces sp. NPDC003077]|uniref:RICIN domain-containing protein n=1 Tax=Streptomyces sp. NPDC003077 TaxID=3154443 RepID=UPI0033BC04C0
MRARRSTTAAAWSTALLALAVIAGTASPVAAAPDRPPVAPSPAPAAPRSSSADAQGPPTSGRFFVQNLVSGYNMSAGKEWIATHRPKGDEDGQQWEFARNANGTYKIKNPDRDGKCLTEKNNPEGESRVVLGACDAAKTDWEFRHDAGERYRIFVPGTQRRLWGEPVLDSAMQVKITDRNITNQDWYVTPIAPARTPMPAAPKLDDMTFLTAHNAMHNTEDQSASGAPFPNQPHSISRQLKDGVRALMLDAHFSNGRVRLCHEIKILNPCNGNVEASKIFQNIADFLEQDKEAILTVFLEDYTTADQLKQELGSLLGEGKPLAGKVFRPDAEGVKENGWPTVKSMVDSGKRLLLFTADTAASDPANGKHRLGFMSQADWTVENYWSMGSGLGKADWSCYSRWDRVPLSLEEKGFRRLFVMNHFRDVPMDPTYRNDNEKLQNRAERFCAPAARKKPNFLAVDEYKDGDPMAAVRALNTYTYHGDTPGMGGTAME